VLDIVRGNDQSNHWRQISFVVFDAPAASGPFEARQTLLPEMFGESFVPYARVLEQDRCTGIGRLQTELVRVEPQALRDNAGLRQHVAREMIRVQSVLDGLLVDRPRRNILRRPR
jgi:hypothetical protein